MTRALLLMREHPIASPQAAGSAAVQAHLRALQQLEDAASSFMRAKDVEGTHCCARLIWNAGRYPIGLVWLLPHAGYLPSGMLAQLIAPPPPPARPSYSNPLHPSIAAHAGLPLLQPELRRHLRSPFATAAKALEVVASPLHRLRVQLHVESAKCEAAEDAPMQVFGPPITRSCPTWRHGTCGWESS